MVALAPTRLMLVLITDTGRVEQRVVDCPAPVGEAVARRAARPAQRRGRRAPARRRRRSCVADLPDAFAPEDRGRSRRSLATLLETLVEQTRGARGARRHGQPRPVGHDFPRTIRPVLEALEEQVVLLRLLGEATDRRA